MAREWGGATSVGLPTPDRKEVAGLAASGAHRRAHWRRKVAPYVFISPFFVLFLAFSAFPLLFSLYLSFHSWNGIGAMKFVGLKNYTYLLTDDIFWKAVRNTIVLMFESAVPQHILALFFAFILNLGLVKFKNFFKAALFLPYLTAAIAISLLFRTLFSYRMGLLNYALEWVTRFVPFKALLDLLRIGLPINWLGKAAWLKPSISMLIIWQWTGWNTILYLAGLQAIDSEYYDAARVDGANWWQVFFHVTLPMLRPMIVFAVTLSIIGSMQLFTEPLILTDQNGGASMAGYTVAMNLYQVAFSWTYFGSAAAISWVLFLMIFAFSLINLRLLGQGRGEESL